MNNLTVKTIKLKDLFGGPGLLDKYFDPYGYLASYSEQWPNFIRENPWIKEEDILIILTLSGKTVVGHLGLIPSLALMNGKVPARVFWLCSFFLEAAYKNSGAGGLMLLKAMHFSKNLVACGAPSEDACRLYKGTGFEELSPLKRYVYFYNSGIILEKIFRRKPGLNAFTSPANFFLKIYYKFRSPKRIITPCLKFERVNFFSEGVNRIFDSFQRSYFVKNTSFLNWLLKHKQELYGFEIKQKGTLIGYLILRKRHSIGGGSHNLPEMEKGTFLDYFLTSESRSLKRELICFAVDFFKGRGVDLLEIQSIDKDFFDICAELGMIHLGGNKTFLRLSKETKSESQSEWFITHGTGDCIL